jgi:hypothetical protein
MMTPLPDRSARLCIAAAALAAVLAGAGTAHAAMAPDPLEGWEPIDRAELGEARGGMMINGIPINFALVMRSMVEGATTPHGLETIFTINDVGGIGSATTTAIGDDTATLTRTANGGFSLALPSGPTITHEALAGHITAMMHNSADGLTLTQQIDLNVELPGFTAAQQSWTALSRASRASLDAALSGLKNR